MGLPQEMPTAETGQDAPDHRGAEGDALPLEQDLERKLAHAGMLLPEREHCLLLGGGPLLPTDGLRAAGSGFQAGQIVRTVLVSPTVDRRDRDLKGDRRRGYRAALGVLQTQQPVPCLRTEGREGRELPGEVTRDAADDRLATAHAALVHPASIPLAMLGHEGILPA
jgi:hypothetical protein